MWMAYLRFDKETETRNAFVKCANRREIDAVLAAAKSLGSWELSEYVTFYAHATIHAKDVPNFPEDLIFTASDFLAACGAPGMSRNAPGRSPRPGGTPSIRSPWDALGE